MGQNWLWYIDGAHECILRLVGHIADSDGGQLRRGAVLAGLEDERRAATPGVASSGRDGGLNSAKAGSVLVMVQPGQSLCQILGVHQLVWCIL